jgi:hypothetical protein
VEEGRFSALTETDNADFHVCGPVLGSERGIVDDLGRGLKEGDGLVREEIASVLSEGLDSDIIECIRRNTNTGRPTGSEAFVRSLEKQLGRRLTR